MKLAFMNRTSILICRVVAQAVSCWLLTAAARVRARSACGNCGGQAALRQDSPANHSTYFSIIIITRGSHNRPIGDRNAEWTQLDSTPTIPIFFLQCPFAYALGYSRGGKDYSVIGLKRMRSRAGNISHWNV
jgi:hypothetical protein